MTTLPIVVDDTEVTVAGFVDTVQLQLDVGAQGSRGNVIFSGSGTPPSTPPGSDPIFDAISQFIYGDMYINTASQNLSSIWQYRDVLGVPTWVDIIGPDVLFFSGTGTPEGAVAAEVSSLFHRTDGGSGTSVYIKESGSGDTGWAAIVGSASGPPFADNTDLVKGSVDPTRLLRIEVDAITTGTTRTITMPDANVDLTYLTQDLAATASPSFAGATFTAASTFQSALTITDATPSTSSITGSLIVGGGAGIAGDLYVGGEVFSTGATYRSVSATDAFVVGDRIIDCTANSFTVSLPAAGNVGREYILKNSGSGVITLDADAAETIDGAATQTLVQYVSLTVVDDGTGWIIL